MAPVIPCSVCSVSLIPGNTFPIRKSRYIARFNCSTKSIKQVPFLSQRFHLPFPTTAGIFPRCRTECASQYRPRITRLSATGTDLIVEEQDLPSAGEESVGSSEEPSTSSETTEDLSSAKSDTRSSPAQSKRPRAARRSDMPPVKKEDLVPGATFTGKVRSIQPFGAFVDFGAFTDGLVHVSRISDNFVKDITSFVSVGQEVKVRLVEVNTETGRISLSMRDNDDTGRQTQRKDASSSSSGSSGEKGKPSRRNASKGNQRKVEVKKASKYFEGQELSGTVKNKNRSGAFVFLPEGEEGFLPVSEESDDNGPNVMDGSSLEIGQEVNVRVLRISRGKVTLTMKKEKDSAKNDEEINVGIIHSATNPFVLAFRKNKDISVFLDEREMLEDEVDESSQTRVEEATISSDQVVLDGEDKSLSDGNETEVIGDEKLEVEAAQSPGIEEEVIKTTGLVVEDDKESSLVEKEIEASVAEKIEVEATRISEAQEKAETKGEQLGQTIESKVEEATKENDQIVVNGGNLPLSLGKDIETSAAEELQVEAVGSLEIDNEKTVNTTDEVVVDSEYKSSSVDSEIEASVDEKLDVAQSPETEQEATTAATAPVVVDGEDKSSLVENESGASVDEKLDVAQSRETEQETTTEATVPVVVDGEEKSSSIENEIGASVDENVKVEATQTSETKQEAAPVPDSIGSAAEVTLKETTAKAISPALVKQLREETGAGMMDCKKALSEAGGDLVKAQEFLRKKGLASADKKASRTTAEGRIGSYIHDSRIGVLIEVNCETDFVSRGDIFKELVDDLAMQVAACPQVEYIVPEDVPKETVEKEREIEMQKEDLLSRPEQIRGKIVDGRIKKRLDELALLEQPYIKNDKVLVKDWVKQTIATIGENIKVKRFVKYNLGEGLEKKSQDFAAEVAAQTTAKSVPASPTVEQPAAVEPEKPAESIPKVAVSAAMVKQLREETGAGMMDCKKALTETGGDLVKAQEYLRKKGLSTADKKSSRLAAEGRIGSYIHDSRIGVLLEVNCETDFVGRSEKFKELVDDLAMQIAACPLVKYVSVEDIPEDIRNKEKEIEMQREDILSKPESIREKIVEGRIAKRLGELALLEQPFIKDDSVLVKDLVKQTVAAIGENIKVRRFARFTLGENIDKETEAEAKAEASIEA